MKPRIRTYSPVAAIFVAFAFAGTQSAHAVNAAWNTDAATGDFGSPNWTSGTTTPAAGGIYTVVSGDALFFGTSTTTTLNNDLVGATYNGLTFNSGASAFTIGGNSFTLGGNITNNSASTQTINTNITLNGARTFSATSGQLMFGGNITGSPTGSWTLNPTNKITLGGTNNLTMSANFAALLINAGAGGVDITGSTTITGAAGNAQSGYMNVSGTTTIAIKSGGSLTINGTTNTTPGSIVGQNTNGTSTLSVENGGSLNYSGNVGLAFGNNRADAIGVLNVSGNVTIASGSAVATDQRSYIVLGRDGATGTVNLNTGGVLATGRNFIRDGSAGTGVNDVGGVANFNFNGGTLQALANQTDWLNSSTKNTNQLALSSVTATNTSTIDSNGFSVAINSNISGSGGFNINSSTGTGTVTFGGANTYTGATTVSAGTFALAATGSLASTQISVSSGATYDVSAVSGYTVASGVTLTNNGTVNGGFTVASGSTLNGSGTFNNAVTVNGALNPGNSPGSQTYAAGLTLGAASTTTMEVAGLGGVAGTDFDFINATGGTLTFDGTLAIVDFGGHDISGQTAAYNLFDFVTGAGDFDVVTVDGAALTYNVGTDDWSATSGLVTYNFAESSGVLSVTVVPEPTVALLGGLGLLGLLRRRRVG